MTPLHNARRAEQAARRAAELLGRRMPAAYPARYADELVEARGASYLALMHRHTEGAMSLLESALELEQRAEDAKRAAIEALRWGGLSPSWATIGKVLGFSPAGAHKRYRDVEDPEAQATIDDELQAATA